MDLTDGPDQDASTAEVWIDLRGEPNEDLPPSPDNPSTDVARESNRRPRLIAEGITDLADEISEDRDAAPGNLDPLYYIWVSGVTLRSGRSCSWSRTAWGWVADDATSLRKENFDGLTDFTVYARRSLDDAILRMRYHNQVAQWWAKSPEGSRIYISNWMMGFMLSEKRRIGVAQFLDGPIVGVRIVWGEFEDLSLQNSARDLN